MMNISTLILTCLLTFLTNTISAEMIKISTTSTLKPSTFMPQVDKSTELKEKEPSFFDTVENFLSDGQNKENFDSQNRIKGYMTHPMVPAYPAFNSGGYFYPGINPNAVAQANGNEDVQNTNYYFSAVLPAAQMGFEILRNIFLYFLVRHFILKVIRVFDLVLDIREALLSDETSIFLTKAALQAGLRLFAKVGLFVIGGAALLIIGGIFTTLVCHLTPFCTISFNGYDFKALNKDTVKSLMTPEKIASAAALVQDAIGKYQRLQRAVGQ